jgi:hypothetical protein
VFGKRSPGEIENEEIVALEVADRPLWGANTAARWYSI